MVVGALVLDEEQLLMIKEESGDLSFPICSINSENDAIEMIIERCSQLYIDVVPKDIYYQGNINEEEVLIVSCYIDKLNIDKVNEKKEVVWIKIREIDNINYFLPYEFIINKLKDNIELVDKISDRIKLTSKNYQVKLEINSSLDYLDVWIKSNYGGFCPFIFRIKYSFNSDGNVKFICEWPITRMFAEGDKSDLYVLFSSLMTCVLRICFNKRVYIEEYSLFDEVEVNGAKIIFHQKYCSTNKEDIIKEINELFKIYIEALMLFDMFTGSFSLELEDIKIKEEYKKYFNSGFDNCIEREEHYYSYNYKKGLSLLEISNQNYLLNKLVNDSKFEVVDGVDGKIIYWKMDDYEAYNYIETKRWNEIKEFIDDLQLKDYSVICQENRVFIFEENRIWIWEGDFSGYLVDNEREKIKRKHEYESNILNLNIDFEWKYPVNPERFEELVADLLDCLPNVEKVRTMGHSNNADGGRDLLIYKRKMGEDKNESIYLVIGQCKAYKNSVNKSHVNDIRDTVENFKAEGFFLAVTSNLTVPLIDNLCNLESKMEVDWWTQREIFKMLRCNSYIAERYLDILEIKG